MYMPITRFMELIQVLAHCAIPAYPKPIPMAKMARAPLMKAGRLISCDGVP